MSAEDVASYYAHGREQARLDHGVGRLEAMRTRELLQRWLPAPPAVVLDVGGGAGRYALPLAGEGYQVHLIDPVALHVQQAQRASTAAPAALASIQVGDARALAYDDASADAVLLLGPLYHLTDRADRLQALGQARRVLRPGGVAVIAAISRWASTLDGFARGFLRDADFADIVAADVATGIHHNPQGRAGWFTTAYFHHPQELVEEVEQAHLVPDGPVAVEGLAALAPNLDALLEDPVLRERAMEAPHRTRARPPGRQRPPAPGRAQEPQQALTATPPPLAPARSPGSADRALRRAGSQATDQESGAVA